MMGISRIYGMIGIRGIKILLDSGLQVFKKSPLEQSIIKILGSIRPSLTTQK